MLRWILILISAALVLLVLCSCDQDTTPIRVSCMLTADGRQFVQNDISMKVLSLGRAFYLSDDLIFHLGSRLAKSELHSSAVTYLIPNNMTVTDKRYLAIDQELRLLFFAADNAIYKVGFDGENLTRLSPVGNGNYSAPVLSNCRNYLTAIKDSHITRLDIQTGEWIELTSPIKAQYAVFFSDTSEYYFFSLSTENYQSNIALCKIGGAEQDSTLLMSGTPYSVFYSEPWPNLRSSKDHRYFAIHRSREPRMNDNNWGNTFWSRFYETLMLYDRQTGNSFEIPDCYSYAFAMGSDDLIYSRAKYGMADIMRMDLSNKESTMVWDGYYYRNYYSFSVSEIFVRNDGQKIFIEAWKKAQR